ncbi:MAG: hypothetical protein NZ554_05775, partial [Bryobacteraceae bacterium]|nr:hypothetical protein [Bryobacteraceae bacterium]
VRLFGTNAVFGGNFPEERDAERIARRLRRLGVNVLRLHHMDTSPDRVPAEARSILTTDPFPTLNPVAVRRLRRFLDALRAEGIYVNVNLHVGYEFRPQEDRVPALPGGAPLPTHSKPLHIFHPRMVELQAEFALRLLEALALRGDPVLGMVEINNESSLVDAFQRGLLERTVLGEYREELRAQWNAFLRNRYPSTEALRSAWGAHAPESDQAPLPARDAPAPVLEDFLRFLAQRDAEYLRKMREAVRQATDALVPVAGTQAGFGGLLVYCDSHAEMDYNDNHFYVDHYNFPNLRWDPRDWRIRDSSLVGSGLAAFLNVAAAREAGRPYTVSEFNQPWPNRQAAEIVPALAAFAAFQDWDGVMHFAYAHNRDWDGQVPSGFDLNADWTKFVSFGQAAFLYRRALVRTAKRVLELPVSRALRLRSAREGRPGALAAFFESRLGYDPAIALRHGVAVCKREDAEWPAVPKLGARIESDTGELVFDRDARLLLLQAPEVAGVFGFLAGRKVQAGAIEVELAPSARGFVSLLVTALDGRPIARSGRLLVTIPGCSFGTQPGSDPPRMQRLILYPGTTDWYTIEPEIGSTRPSGPRSAGVPPVWMERVETLLTLRTRGSRLTVYPLEEAGGRSQPLTADHVARVDGGFRIHLQAPGQRLSPWYEILVEVQ